MADLQTIQCEHAVLFYESDAELAGAVVPYLAEGAREDALVVIAEDSHRRDFEAGLEAEGVDLERARAAGTFVSLDAEATLAAFIRDGEMDAEAFEEVVGGVLREAAKRASGIRAYGEMVALLWGAGNVVGAIELERLWNDLASEVDFSLFCAYPAASVDSPDKQDALHEVCELHSLVVPSADAGPRVERMRLEPETRACARARRFVRCTLRRWGVTGTVIDDAILLSSELAANAVTHAQSPFLIEIGDEDRAVRVSVTDDAAAPASPWAIEAAHGLSIVNALCESWGVTGARDGKTVWAVLPTGADARMPEAATAAS
jgi:MEDS: MEthanogen/methylotroph, DcmR Sensory domain/Histidine kinase-like ATPase domain